MKWEIVIGLEVHSELSTKTKIFCNCSTDFSSAPNTNVCQICSGMPGTLPVLNHEVVEYAMALGLALNCTIASNTKFDRKNYFYPDLPKAYQVSQLYSPICTNGSVEIETEDGTKSIGIRQIHMEEDAGKLVHDDLSGVTLMDYNRGGVPLLEIVTMPDFRSAQEVNAFLEQLRETLVYLDICDGKMQEGSMRCDVNISVRPFGGELGTRTEMKNLNSLKAITRAIAYESERQIELIESGGAVKQETRRWDDDIGESFGMRSKENAQDYRYFPDPDLLPILIDENWLNKVREDMPELAAKKRERYISEFSLSQYDAMVLTKDKDISVLFEEVAQESNNPTEAANLITGEIMRLMNKTQTLAEDLKIDSAKLAVLIGLLRDGKINRTAYKDTVEAVFTDDVDPEKYIEEKGLLMISDDGAVKAIVLAVLEQNPDAVADFKAGKEKAFGFLMGQAMKQLKGAGNPDSVKEILRNCL